MHGNAGNTGRLLLFSNYQDLVETLAVISVTTKRLPSIYLQSWPPEATYIAYNLVATTDQDTLVFLKH